MSVNLSGVGPGGEAGQGIESLEESADDLVGVFLGAQAIELRQHLRERFLDLADGALRIVLTMRIEAPLALHELFAVEVGQGLKKDRLCLWTRVGEKA